MNRIKMWGYAALVASGGGTVLYVLLVTREENDFTFAEGAPWIAVMFLIVASTGLAISTRSSSTRRRAFLTSTVLATILGLLGIFTIGILFLLAALFTYAGSRALTSA